MSIKDLRDRWLLSNEGKNAFKILSKSLKRSRTLEGSETPFGTTDDGYYDFRGLNLNAHSIIKASINKFDLSYSDFSDTWIESSSFVDVIFNNVNFAMITDKGNSFLDVNFNKCKFQNARMGYDGSEYKDCRFISGNYSKAGFIRSSFSNCDFLDNQLKGVDFGASRFEYCKFSGLLKDVWFRGGYAYPIYTEQFGKAEGNLMLNVSFEDAELVGVDFSNHCDLTTVKLPKNGKYRFFDNWQVRLEYLQTQIDNWKKPEKIEADIFARLHSRHSNQDQFILNIEQLQLKLGESLANRIISTLNQVA